MEEISTPFWIQLLPVAFYTVFVLAVCFWLAPRKGLSPMYGFIGLVPCVGAFFLLYLLSRTDQSVLDQIADLQRRLSEMEPSRQGPPPIV